MGTEEKIYAYLQSFGNTRESDLINYGVQNLDRSPEKVKKAIDRLAIEGKIHRIVHNRLKPPEVYVTLEEPLPPEVAVERVASSREVERILAEAASLARTRDREAEP